MTSESRFGPREETPQEIAERNEYVDKLVVAAAKQFDEAPTVRKKGIYIGAPACFALELACRQICEAFGGHHCYVVGSCLEKPDWRDVDVRYILEDADFEVLFPGATLHEGGGGCWEQDPRWLLMTVSISEHLSRVTGLPIDFQFQSQTHANARHKGSRSCIGLHIAKETR